MSWLNTLANGEGAAAFSGFLKNLEEKIDKALDIPEDERSESTPKPKKTATPSPMPKSSKPLEHAYRCCIEAIPNRI